MKTSSLTLSILLAAAVGYAGYLQTEVNRLKALAPVGTEFSDSAKVDDGRAAAGTELARRADAPATADVPVEPAPVAEPPQTDRAARFAERMKVAMARFEDPELRADSVERQMNRIDARYGAFFKTLGLDADQMETLRTLMAEREVGDQELRMRRAGTQSEEEREALELARENQRAVIDGQIAELLGDQKATEMQDYTETLPYRQEVQALASSLSYTDSPLSEQQSDALARSIRDVSSTFEYSVDLSNLRRGDLASLSSEDISAYMSERADRDDLVLQAAAESLNDSQLAAYAERQLAERERAQRQIEFMQANPQQGGRFGGGGDRGGPRGPRP